MTKVGESQLSVSAVQGVRGARKGEFLCTAGQGSGLKNELHRASKHLCLARVQTQAGLLLEHPLLGSRENAGAWWTMPDPEDPVVGGSSQPSWLGSIAQNNCSAVRLALQAGFLAATFEKLSENK